MSFPHLLLRARSLAAVLGFSLLAAACAYPESQTVAGGRDSGLYISTALPPGASLFVDDVLVGTAGEFDGVKAVLDVPTGPHKVVVRDGTAVLVEKTVYVGRDSVLEVTP